MQINIATTEHAPGRYVIANDPGEKVAIDYTHGFWIATALTAIDTSTGWYWKAGDRIAASSTLADAKKAACEALA